MLRDEFDLLKVLDNGRISVNTEDLEHSDPSGANECVNGKTQYSEQYGMTWQKAAVVVKVTEGVAVNVWCYACNIEMGKEC